MKPVDLETANQNVTSAADGDSEPCDTSSPQQCCLSTACTSCSRNVQNGCAACMQQPAMRVLCYRMPMLGLQVPVLLPIALTAGLFAYDTKAGALCLCICVLIMLMSRTGCTNANAANGGGGGAWSSSSTNAARSSTGGGCCSGTAAAGGNKARTIRDLPPAARASGG